MQDEMGDKMRKILKNNDNKSSLILKYPVAVIKQLKINGNCKQQNNALSFIENTSPKVLLLL